MSRRFELVTIAEPRPEAISTTRENVAPVLTVERSAPRPMFGARMTLTRDEIDRKPVPLSECSIEGDSQGDGLDGWRDIVREHRADAIAEAAARRDRYIEHVRTTTAETIERMERREKYRAKIGRAERMARERAGWSRLESETITSVETEHQGLVNPAPTFPGHPDKTAGEIYTNFSSEEGVGIFTLAGEGGTLLQIRAGGDITMQARALAFLADVRKDSRGSETEDGSDPPRLKVID